MMRHILRKRLMLGSLQGCVHGVIILMPSSFISGQNKVRELTFPLLTFYNKGQV